MQTELPKCNGKVPAMQDEHLALCKRIEEILNEEIELSKPDSLAWFESQVPYIAPRIARLLRLRAGL